jgi:hypothetical protein
MDAASDRAAAAFSLSGGNRRDAPQGMEPVKLVDRHESQIA